MLELSQLGLAKQQLDAEVLPQLQQRARECEQGLEHLLGVLQGSLRASAHLSTQLCQSMQTGAEEARQLQNSGVLLLFFFPETSQRCCCAGRGRDESASFQCARAQRGNEASLGNCSAGQADFCDADGP